MSRYVILILRQFLPPAFLSVHLLQEIGFYLLVCFLELVWVFESGKGMYWFFDTPANIFHLLRCILAWNCSWLWEQTFGLYSLNFLFKHFIKFLKLKFVHNDIAVCLRGQVIRLIRVNEMMLGFLKNKCDSLPKCYHVMYSPSSRFLFSGFIIKQIVILLNQRKKRGTSLVLAAVILISLVAKPSLNSNI